MAMDVFEAIVKRRRVVDFTDRTIDRSTMTQILEAARWSPSGGNQQRWRFIVVTDPNTKEMIGDVSPGIYGSPTAIVAICVKMRPRANEWDRWMEACEVGIAAQNIALAAFALGVGSCMIASFARESVEQILDLPEGIEPQLLVTLGYYAQLPEPPGRLPLDEIAFSERYGREWKP
jgi:nitroreductase